VKGGEEGEGKSKGSCGAAEANRVYVFPEGTFTSQAGRVWGRFHLGPSKRQIRGAGAARSWPGGAPMDSPRASPTAAWLRRPVSHTVNDLSTAPHPSGQSGCLRLARNSFVSGKRGTGNNLPAAYAGELCSIALISSFHGQHHRPKTLHLRIRSTCRLCFRNGLP